LAHDAKTLHRVSRGCGETDTGATRGQVGEIVPGTSARHPAAASRAAGRCGSSSGEHRLVGVGPL